MGIVLAVVPGTGPVGKAVLDMVELGMVEQLDMVDRLGSCRDVCASSLTKMMRMMMSSRSSKMSRSSMKSKSSKTSRSKSMSSS